MMKEMKQYPVMLEKKMILKMYSTGNSIWTVLLLKPAKLILMVSR